MSEQIQSGVDGANKANIVDKREKEAFDDEYNEFVSSLNSNINENLWENLEL